MRVAIANLAIMLLLKFMGSMLALSAGLTREEAKNTFTNLGCTGCHNGQTADEFDEILEEIESWAARYSSIDDAIRGEVTYFGGKKFSGLDDLLETMAGNVGKTPDDPGIARLREFFVSEFEKAKAAATASPTESTMKTTSPQTTTPATGRASRTPFYIAVGLGLAIAIVVIALFTLKR